MCNDTLTGGTLQLVNFNEPRVVFSTIRYVRPFSSHIKALTLAHGNWVVVICSFFAYLTFCQEVFHLFAHGRPVEDISCSVFALFHSQMGTMYATKHLPLIVGCYVIIPLWVVMSSQ